MIRSPPFEREIEAEAIAAGGQHSVNWEGTNEPEAQYIPLNTLYVSNFSGQRIRVHYGAGHRVTIRPNSSAVIEDYGIRGYTIENLGAVANDDIIEVVAQRNVTELHATLAKLTGRPLKEIVEGKGW